VVLAILVFSALCCRIIIPCVCPEHHDVSDTTVVMKEDPVVVVVAPPCCVACKQPIEKVEGKFIGESTDVSKVRP